MKRKSITSFITLVTLILGILFSSLIFAETNIPSATDDFYVNDFANVFSAVIFVYKNNFCFICFIFIKDNFYIFKTY